MGLMVRDYKCNACGATGEYFVKDDEEPECKTCKSKEMSRQLSSPALLVTNGVDAPSHRKRSK